MDFSIVTDTAGANVGELAKEIEKQLEPKVNEYFTDNNVSIGFAIRCLPDSYNRKSFVRYTKADNYLTIDFSVSLEEYQKMYKIEQKYNLGKSFLFWLEKGLDNKKFVENNLTLDREKLLDKIKEWGQEIGWFLDEIDWGSDLGR